MMVENSLDRAKRTLKFDDSLLKKVYPDSSHNIMLHSKVRTEIMKDADHNPRRVGAVVRAILNAYYFKGGFSGKGSSVGRGRVDVGVDIKKAVRGLTKEQKKANKIKAKMAGELSGVLERFKQQAETRVGDDDNRLRMIELERAEALRKYEEEEKKGITLKRKENGKKN